MGSSKFKWFLFAFLIPLIFVIVLYAVILSIMGKSFGDQVKALGSHVPIVATLFDEPEKPNDQSEAASEKEILRLSDEIKRQEHDIEALEQKLVKKDQELKTAKEKIAKLERRVQNNAQEETKETDEGNTVKETGKLLLSMSPKDAALIIAEMDNKDAIPLLQSFKPDESGKILAKLEPKRASQLMKQLLAEE